MEVREKSAKYETKVELKQTAVGLIPQDWEVKRLSEISPSQSVGLVINPSSHFEEHGNVPMLVGSNLSANRIAWESARRISESSNAALTASRLRAGDLVTVRVGEPGITAVVPPELDGCNCASVMIVRRHKDFDSHWLAYLMNSPTGLGQVQSVQYGTAQKQFNISDAVAFLFPAPPSAEQGAIAKALRNVDALIESLEQLIAKKRHIKQGAMQELMSGERRLPGFSGEWERKTFGDVARPRKERIDPRTEGPQGFCIELEHIDPGSGRLLGSGSTGETSSLKSVFYPDDVLFGKLRAYLRKYWLADCRGVCSTEVWVLVASSWVDAKFLFHVVTGNEFIEAASNAYGTHMPRSDWNVVTNYELAVPPLPEQTAIATILSDMDAELTALEAKLTKTRQLKQGMMRELLTGRIRLV